MDSYLLVIYVTLEQEIAVRQLFLKRGWGFKKYEGAEFEDDLSVKDGARSHTNQSVYPDNDHLFSPLFQSGEEKQSSIPGQQQEAPQKPRTVSFADAAASDTNVAMENEVMTKLAEIMEDSLRNMPDSTGVKSNLGDAKTERYDNVYLGNAETPSSYGKGDNAYSDLNHCSVDYSKVENSYASANDNLNAMKSISDKSEGNESRKYTKIKLKFSKSFKKKKKANVNKSKFSTHLKTHEKKSRNSSKKCGSYHCEDCKITFKLLGAFKNHKKDGQCVFECEFCGKKFTARYHSNYLAHLKYHSADRPHACHLCDKTYKDAHTLKIHLRTHSGDRPFVCDTCGKSFYSSSNLLFHKQSSHEASKIFKCHLCSAVLSTSGNLRVHLKLVHTSERPYTCEICGKTFKTQKSLEQIHSKVHQEVFPFKCTITGCDKAFKRIDGLNNHIRRHNNERTHFCERCGKGFYCNKDLQLHSRTHSGLKPYSCQLCDYKCALAGNMRKHRKTHQ